MSAPLQRRIGLNLCWTRLAHVPHHMHVISEYAPSRWHTPVARTTLSSGSFDMSSTRLASSGDGAVAGVCVGSWGHRSSLLVGERAEGGRWQSQGILNKHLSKVLTWSCLFQVCATQPFDESGCAQVGGKWSAAVDRHEGNRCNPPPQKKKNMGTAQIHHYICDTLISAQKWCTGYCCHVCVS